MAIVCVETFRRVDLNRLQTKWAPHQKQRDNQTDEMLLQQMISLTFQCRFVGVRV